MLNCDVFFVEGRELRYGVICMLCAGEVVELLIGLRYLSKVSRTGSTISHLFIH